MIRDDDSLYVVFKLRDSHAACGVEEKQQTSTVCYRGCLASDGARRMRQQRNTDEETQFRWKIRETTRNYDDIIDV